MRRFTTLVMVLVLLVGVVGCGGGSGHAPSNARVALQSSFEGSFVAERGNVSEGGVECSFGRVLAGESTNAHKTNEPELLCDSYGVGAVKLLADGPASRTELGNPLTYSFKPGRKLRTGETLTDAPLECTALGEAEIRCQSQTSHYQFVARSAGKQASTTTQEGSAPEGGHTPEEEAAHNKSLETDRRGTEAQAEAQKKVEEDETRGGEHSIRRVEEKVCYESGKSAEECKGPLKETPQEERTQAENRAQQEQGEIEGGEKVPHLPG